MVSPSAAPGAREDTPTAHPAPRARILLVEDDPDTARLLARFLGQDYDVTVAADGAEGLASAESAPPDLIIADVMMPKMDGFAMVHRLRREGHALPVIFLTARARPIDVVHGINLGARHYLTKPVRLEDLERKVRRALHHEEPA